MTGFNSMGITNNFWGICGFNSSLYALYVHNPKMRAKLGQGASSPTRMLAEIKTFLRMLQAEKKTEILEAIEAFTRTFDKFENFTIESYINRINDVVDTQSDITQDPKFSIAMPPDAVIAYLKIVCGFNNARLVDPGSSASELVLGLFRDDGANMGTYGGLRHYVYYPNGAFYSWGQQFSSIGQMKRNYGGICHKIAL